MTSPSNLTFNNSVVKFHADKSSIITWEDENLQLFQDKRFIKDVPFRKRQILLARVSSQPDYTFIATITKFAPPLEVFHQSEEHKSLRHSLSKLNNSTEDQTPKYFVSTLLHGLFPSSFHTLLHLEESMTDQSFKGAVLYHDPQFTHDYFILGLEKGQLYVFKSLLQNAEMHYEFLYQIDSRYEIIQMEIHNGLIFILLGDSEGKIKITILKLTTYGTLAFKELCTLDNENTSVLPELKVKSDQNSYILLVNFPTQQQLIVYSFPRPEFEFSALQCPTNYDTITYKNLSNPLSFNYIITQTAAGNYQGISLFSQTTPETSFHFIPYCMMNMYLDNQNQTCQPCKTGSFSPGGFTSSCSSTIPPGVGNSFLEDCKKQRVPLTICSTCTDYMTWQNVIIPEDAYWQLNKTGHCQIQCKQGVFNRKLGTCLTQEQSEIIKDPCKLFDDCLNCSLSQTCSWIAGSCANSLSHGFRRRKTSLLEDALQPALECQVPKYCGQIMHRNSSGAIHISANDLQKNEICAWKIQPRDRQNNEIQLTVITQDHLKNEPFLGNFPDLYLHYTKYNLTSIMKESSFESFRVDQEVVRADVAALDLTVYMVIQEGIIGTNELFKIEYKVMPMLNPVQRIVMLFRWIYYIVFMLAVFFCALASFRDMENYVRRRRLLVELQGLGDIDDTDIGGERDHIVDVRKMIKEKKVVSSVMNGGGRQIQYDQTDCVICLEEFKTGENLAEFVCKHVFHIKCLEKWVISAQITSTIKCPVCNRILFA